MAYGKVTIVENQVDKKMRKKIAAGVMKGSKESLTFEAPGGRFMSPPSDVHVAWQRSYLRLGPRPLIVTTMDNGNYIRVPISS